MKCITCYIGTFVVLFTIIVTLNMFEFHYYNQTLLTHSVPNIVDYISYGKKRTQIPYVGELENGTKFAEFESLIDRIRRRNTSKTFVPPKQYIYLEEKEFDMDEHIFHKFDSVPPILRDVALPRPSAYSRTPLTGTSVFVTNYVDRGPNNEMKRKYMEGLDNETIHTYVDMCKDSMKVAIQCMENGSPHDCIFEAVKNITFLVHAGTPVPDGIHKKFIETGAEAFSSVAQINTPEDAIFMPTITQKHILKHKRYIRELKQLKPTVGLFKTLKDNGYKEEDIMVEYLHNILALTLQWTILMEELLERNENNATDLFIYHHLQNNPTAAFVVSSMDIDGHSPPDDLPTHTVHDMKEIMKGKQASSDYTVTCPYTGESYKVTPEGAIVMKGTSIIEQEGNWGFGRGYRRCAGEVLTLEMMKEWIRTIHQKPYQFTKGIKTATFGFGYKYNSTISFL